MIALAERAARAAGALVRERGQFTVRHKGRVDLVTEVDLAAEAIIREILEAGSPGIPILGEEGGGATEATTRWIVDPLDGTTNFVHDFPFYCVSIALQDGDLQVAAIYDVPRDVCYTAERGKGAQVEGSPIRVSETASLSQALVASGFAYDRRERADFYLRFLKVILEQAQGFRRAGAAALDLALLASGRLDGIYEFGLSTWDVAAGALLVEEAGGKVTDMRGLPLDLNAPQVLATNGRIHAEMAALLAPLIGS
jgi:myo-inositol-1(or 4)-monophosphatase